MTTTMTSRGFGFLGFAGAWRTSVSCGAMRSGSFWLFNLGPWVWTT
jgi:hypothetical protein